MKIQTILLCLAFMVSFACEEKGCTETIKENCVCTYQYNPVCGCNGKTYGNACEAECHGITDYEPGTCEE